MTKVSDVMTWHPATIRPDASLATARETMEEKGIRHLPVTDESGTLLGILSDRDVRSAAFAPAVAEFLSEPARRRLRGVGRELAALRVRDIMTWDAVTIDPGADVAHAAAIMFEGRFGSLPVVETRRLVGILTRRDALKALAASLPAIRGSDPDTFLW